MLTKVLVANRGEIACRIIRGCKSLGIRTVAIYSEADASALHVALADEAAFAGPSPVAQSYLRADRIVELAKNVGADAVHPGYGLLSENAAFASRCRDAGLVFVGPPASAMEAMGSKVGARAVAAQAGMPVVPGSAGAAASAQAAAEAARLIGFPVMLKASAGGGGIGMVTAYDEETLLQAFESSVKRVKSYFGDGTMYVEKYIPRPRHVEIQILADTHGNALHFGERECSIQRRHQKIVEEAPSPAVTKELRERMGESALRLVRELGYTGVGTVEFLLDEDGQYYFLEMNTRLQVEHPVTEEAYGVDLVEWQLRVAAGEALAPELFGREPVRHAIECRVCAEDPVRLLPSPGLVTTLRLPEGAGIRHEIGIREGDSISPYYDPMFAKMIVSGVTRDEACVRMAEALDRYEVAGVKSNIPLLSSILHDEEFLRGNTHTSFLRERGLMSSV
ncbi:MAG: acetyl-CoA carboxylase biotin carboxylase subunit [Bacilli bacterium]